MEILGPMGITIKNLSLHNFGNGRNYLDNDSQTGCSVVNGARRTHLNLSWDFNVLPCCHDYNAEIIFGNLHEQSIYEIFNGEKYKKFIAAHITGNLNDYPLCIGCNEN
jgi:hypothetical protein